MATNGSSQHLTPENSTRKVDLSNGNVITVPYNPPRPRPRTDIDLEAGETINLGEFQEAGAHALSISEARLIVERTEQMRKKQGQKLRETEYVASLRNRHFVEEVRRDWFQELGANKEDTQESIQDAHLHGRLLPLQDTQHS